MKNGTLRKYFSPERFFLPRKALGLTLADVAELLSVSPSYLSDIENNHKVPSDTLIQLFLAKLSLSEDFFVSGTGRMFTEKAFAGRLLQALEEKNITVKNLPALTGLNKKEIAALITGESRNDETIDLIAQALAVAPRYLATGHNSEAPPPAHQIKEIPENYQVDPAYHDAPLSVRETHVRQMMRHLEQNDPDTYQRVYDEIVKSFLAISMKKPEA